jgi:hypothetical protein
MVRRGIPHTCKFSCSCKYTCERRDTGEKGSKMANDRAAVQAVLDQVRAEGRTVLTAPMDTRLIFRDRSWMTKSASGAGLGRSSAPIGHGASKPAALC